MVLRLLLDSSPAPKLLFLFWSGCDIPDEILQLLSRAEDSDSMPINGNDISSLRIACLLSALSYANLECSESAELDNTIVLETILDFLEKLIDHRVDISPVDAKLSMKALDNRSLCEFLFHIAHSSRAD